MSIFFCNAECRQNCEEECSKERKCYVDQNEVKVGPFDIMAYPQGTRIPSTSLSGSAIGPGNFASAIRNRCGPPATPSTAASLSDRRYPNRPRMAPTPASWADSWSSAAPWSFSLTPKQNGSSAPQGGLRLEDQMRMAQGGAPPPGRLQPTSYSSYT